MTKKEHEELVEQAVREYALEMKRDRDRDTVIAYGAKLARTTKMYSRQAEAYSTGGQKGRAYAIGACVLQLVAQIEKDAKDHNFLPGTMEWTINEDRVKDEDGRKGYKYTVAFHVASGEAAYTDEEIEKEVQDLTAKLEAETREMFDLTEEEEAGEVKDTSIQ